MKSELYYACSMSNSHIRNIIASYINDIQWTSPLADEVKQYFHKLKGGTPSIIAVKTVLSENYIEEEVQEVCDLIDEFANIVETEDQELVIEGFSKFYNNKRATEIINTKDITSNEIIQAMREIPDIATSDVPFRVLGALDVDEVIEEELGDLVPLPSAFNIIKEATPWQGYLRGQVVQVVAPPGCVHGDTIVCTPDGDVAIRDLLAEQAQPIVSWCQTINPTLAEVKLDNICEEVITNVTSQWIELHFENGSSIKVTPDHPILMINSQYMRADEIQPGDRALSIADLKGVQPVRTPVRVGAFTEEVMNQVVDTDTANKKEVNHSELNIVDVTVHELIDPEVTYDMSRAAAYANYACKVGDTYIFAHNTGKSLFIANEIIQMLAKKHTCYFVALGDMFMLDFIIRLSTIITGEDYYKVAASPKKYFTDKVKDFTKGIGITVAPSGVFTLDQLNEILISTVIPQIGPVDAFVLDYDANLKKQTDSMYEEGGVVYDTLTQIARPQGQTYRVVFVASQPKIQYWELDKLPKEAAGESSKKQAVIDLMITMGKAQNTRDHHCGIIYVAKARRGKEGLETPYLVSSCGRIREITREQYAGLRNARS